MQEVHQGHHRLPQSTEPDRHKILVWLGQSGIIIIMHSAWLTRCYPSGNYSSPATRFTGMKGSSKPSNSRNSPSSTKSTTESKKTKPTCLTMNWSKQGIGYWLFQKHCSCPSNDLFCCKQGWKITLVGSRFTHAAESRYAPIKGEALAVADALDKARHFVLGCKNLTVAVDHSLRHSATDLSTTLATPDWGT